MISWEGEAFEESSQAGCCAQHVTSENRKEYKLKLAILNFPLTERLHIAYCLHLQFPAPCLSPYVCGFGYAGAWAGVVMMPHMA